MTGAQCQRNTAALSLNDAVTMWSTECGSVRLLLSDAVGLCWKTIKGTLYAHSSITFIVWTSALKTICPPLCLAKMLNIFWISWVKGQLNSSTGTTQVTLKEIISFSNNDYVLIVACLSGGSRDREITNVTICYCSDQCRQSGRAHLQ